MAEDLLRYLDQEHGIRSVRRLDASLLRAFLFERVPGRSSECVRLPATSLRSFLRFLHAKEDIPRDLSAAILTVRRWTQPDIPKKLTPAPVKQVLQAPDRNTATGRRDYAILLLLARLGLRSSEIFSIDIVRRAMTKAGVERPRQIAAHLFRHTLASSMLQHGANLREISEVPRHHVPIAPQQKGDPPYSAPHSCHDASAARGGHYRDRPLAGARVH